jgi:hypothetical protein
LEVVIKVSKAIAVLACVVLILPQQGCMIKSAVQNKTKEAVHSVGGSSAEAGDLSNSSDNSLTDAGGTQRKIASVDMDDYFEGLRENWKNEPEEGYVWTINISGVESLDVMGIAKVDYDLNFSASHVGKDMFGPYSGEMHMSYNANLDGLVQLMTLTGGSVDYDADGWFEDTDFIMNLHQYDDVIDESFEDSIGSTAAPEEDTDPEAQAIADEYLSSILGGIGSGDKQFELDNNPAGCWFDWTYHMTDGDMSGYLQMTNIAYGTTSASGTVDASGVYTQGSATASIPLVGTFSERYSETIETPFPYIIRVYETGEVVFELYSANGGPVTVKFYGTIDKKRVEDTEVVKK